MTLAAAAKPPRPAAPRPLWVSASGYLMYTVTALLMVAGIAPAVLRYTLSADTHQWLSRLAYADYADIQLPVLASYPVAEVVHRLGGTVYFLIAAMQFSTPMRNRWLKLHRALGYTFTALSVLVVGTAFFYVVHCPYNRKETLPTLLAGTYMLACLAQAVHLIRQSPPKVQQHREWMTRSLSIGLSIGLVRLVFLPFHYGLGMSGYRYLGFSFWLCWFSTIAVCEWWIWAQRPHRKVGTTGTLPTAPNLAATHKLL